MVSVTSGLSFHNLVKKFDVPNVEVSVDLFKNLVGETRLQRICSRPEICIDIKKSTFNREEATKVFLGMLDIQKEDLDELKGSTASRFQKLMPFKNFKDLDAYFFNDVSIERFKIDKAKTSGKGLRGLNERVYVLAQHHFKLFEKGKKEEKAICDAEMLTSRLADREIKKNQVIHLSDGYFYADEIFTAGGAYVAVLKDVEGLKAPKIVCRGTAGRLNATSGWQSGLNNILIEVGTLGVKSIWPKLSKYLIENKIQSVEVLGKSLGGAHAQQLSVLIEGIHGITVEKLTTYGSIGVSEGINRLFDERVLAKRTKPFNIHVIRNAGEGVKNQADYIPYIGGKHLGSGVALGKCSVKSYYIGSSSEEIKMYPEKIAFCSLIKQFFRSFSTSHCRQTTLGKFSYKKVRKAYVNKHLSIGQTLESLRKVFAYIIQVLTFFCLNGSSFNTFYFKEQKQKRAHSN